MATQPLFDMSKAQPITATAPANATPLFDMSKAVPIGYQGPMTSTGIAAPMGTATAGDAWKSVKQTGGDLATGASQGAANTVGSSIVGVARLLNKIPALGQYLAPQQGIDALASLTAQRSTPENTAQAIGKIGEQVGEFLLPGAGEEDAVAHLAPWLSRLGRAATPAARIAYQAGTTGLINAAQGGSPVTGAATGAAGGAVGEGLRAVAPAMAESALGITKRMRGYQKTPGLAALQETTGLSPGAIESQAQQKLGELTSHVENSASAKSGLAPQQPLQPSPPTPQNPVSMHPALGVIDNEIAKATRENNGQAVEQLGRVRDAITKNITTGAPIPSEQTPTGALNLKRGLRSQFVKNWNPELMEGTRSVAAQASGAIDNQLDNALGPDFQSANQRISSLIPVADRSESLGRDPGLIQNVGNRMAAHTGALIGSAALGAEGYHKAGIPGALGGLISGAALPELLVSPEIQMAAARTLHNPTLLLNLLRGAGMQFDRSNQQPEQQAAQQ